MATINTPFWITTLYTRTWNLSQEWCVVSASVQATMAFAFMLIMGLITLNRYIKIVMVAAFFPSKAVARLHYGVVRLILVLSTRPPLWGWGRMKFDSYVFVYTFNWKEGRTIFLSPN